MSPNWFIVNCMAANLEKFQVIFLGREIGIDTKSSIVVMQWHKITVCQLCKIIGVEMD